MSSIRNLIFKTSSIMLHPKKKPKLNSLDEVDPELLRTYERLGISVEEQKSFSRVADCGGFCDG